jgi:phospholipid/cholesterol/gamma-HCH transport system substrate-binding protein
MTLGQKNLLIGSFALAACFLIALSLLFLHPSYGDGGKVIHVRFTNIDKITVGTRVTMAGKPIGSVESIEEVFDARTETAGPYGRAYFYDLTLKVDSKVHIYKQDQILTNTSGFMGEKTIAIIPKALSGKSSDIEVTDQILYASSSASFDHALEELLLVSTKIGETMDMVLQIVGNNSEEIDQTFRSVSKAAEKFDNILGTLETSDVLTSFEQSSKHLTQSLQQVNKGLTKLSEEEFWDNLASTTKSLNGFSQAFNQPEDIKETIHNFKELTGELTSVSKQASSSFNSLDKTLAQLDSITQAISNKKGTVGRLIMEDDLYLKSYSMLSKVNTLMNDLNHYGLLFHRDKGWQRLRTTRINKLSRLQSSDAFKQYFDQEVESVQTSLARIEELISLQKRNKAPEGSEEYSDEFKGELKLLLDIIDDLQESLELFNQGVSNKS